LIWARLGPPFVRAPGEPVVRGIDHQRVVVLTDGAQSVHDGAYPLVDRLQRFELIDAKLVGVGLLLRRPGLRLDPRRTVGRCQCVVRRTEWCGPREEAE